MKKFFQNLTVVAGICIALGINLQAAQLKDGKVTINAVSGKITKPFAVKEIDGIKHVIGSKKGAVEYDIEVMEDGEYVIWAKACGLSSNNNSFFVIIAKKPVIIWDIIVTKDKKTKWQKIKGRKKMKQAKVKLTKGKHKLIIKGREPGSRLEKIFIGKVGMAPPK